MRIQQNQRHSKRFETHVGFTSRITRYLQAEAGTTLARTFRKRGALSSLGRDLFVGLSANLTPSVFAGVSLRQKKTVFSRPLAYLREAHQVDRRTFTCNIGLYLTKDKTTMIDFHFARTSSSSQYSPDNFIDDAVIVYFQHVL